MKTLVIFVLLSISFSIFANTDAQLLIRELERELDTCIEQDSTTIGMRICLANQYGQLDDLLNKTYRELRASLEEGPKSKLIQSQRDWIKYRTSNCEFEGSSVMGGTMETIIMMDCDNQMTIEKIKQLDTRLNGPQ